MRIALLFVFVFLFGNTKIYSQELECQVTVSHAQIQGSEVQVYKTLQKAIFDFMNTRKWTNINFKNEERIECSIFIDLKTKTGDNYSGTIQVQSRRAVFNSSYTSTLLNFKDNDLVFTYVEHDGLDFDVNSFVSNLTSVLGYYAYLIIGYDFDTYSLNGGNPYFNYAQTIVNNAQNAPEKGWKAYENSNKNRYWVIENILNSTYSDYRSFLYKHHRLGLDVMAENPTQGRQEILKSLELLQKVNQQKYDLIIVLMVFDAKKDEYIGVFSGAPMGEREKAVKILVSLDPTSGDDYYKITKGGR